MWQESLISSFFPLSFVLVGHVAAEKRRRGNNATCPSPASTLFFFVCLIKKPPRKHKKTSTYVIRESRCTYIHTNMYAFIQTNDSASKPTDNNKNKKEPSRQFILTFFFGFTALRHIMWIYTVSFSFPLCAPSWWVLFFFSSRRVISG